MRTLIEKLSVEDEKSSASYATTLEELFNSLSSKTELAPTDWEAISVHANPHTSWSSPEAAQTVQKILDLNCNGIDEFIEQIAAPRIQALAKTERTTPAGYAAKRAVGGLRPRLGFTEMGAPSIPDSTFSMVYFCISAQNCGSWYSSRWSMVTSFTLKVLDDPSAPVKLKACQLLRHFILFPQSAHLLQRTGLHELFSDSTKMCLSYLPGMTPLEHSLPLLDIAYPIIFELESTHLPKMLDLLSGLLKALMLKINEPDERQAQYKLSFLFLRKLQQCIDVLEHRFVASMSRINYSLNQIIVNPGTTEYEMGPQLVREAINLQVYIMRASEKFGCQDIVTSYQLDMLGAWAIASKRFGLLTSEALSQLQRISNDPQLERAITTVTTEYNIAFT